MAFPFYPVGLLTATLFLGGALALLRLLVLVLDRGAAELRGSIGPGLVRGVEAWIVDRESPESPSRAAMSPHGANPGGQGSMPAGATLEELTGPPDIAVEAVRNHGR
jgi:hypothetical protein